MEDLRDRTLKQKNSVLKPKPKTNQIEYELGKMEGKKW